VENPSVAVIGAGLMGHGLAQLFAQAGMAVTLYDSNPQVLASAIPRIQSNLRTMVEAGFLEEAAAGAIPARIAVTGVLAGAVAHADFIFEAVYEDMAVKHAVLAAIEGSCTGEAIIASNSSCFRVGEMASVLAKPERFVGTHFWNPPYLIPIVEVTAGTHSTEESVEAICALLRSAGKRPVRVRQDVAGFIGNRLQHALRREAMAMVEAGIATAEDIDLVARFSFGLRLPLMGPLEGIDLGGIDLSLAIQSYLWPDLDRSVEPSQLVRAKVERGELGAKSGKGFYEWTPERHAEAVRRRDVALLELLQWLRERGLDGV
jgi:3-hydroxybutyryl-CoA dehydrogenase